MKNRSVLRELFSLIVCAALVLTACAGLAEGTYLSLPEGNTPDENGVYRDLGNYIVELWYDSADYEAALAYMDARVETIAAATSLSEADLKKLAELSSGACTACAKINRDGELLMGRNLDVEVSLFPAFIIHTTFGKYKTTSIHYNNHDTYNYDDFRDHGYQDKDFLNYIVYNCTDAMNSEGLYVEANVREPIEEYVSLVGNNPGKERHYATTLVQTIAQNCATVPEALEYLQNEINIVSYPYMGKIFPTQFSYFVGDAQGNYGVIEFAKDQIFFTPYQPAQGNFYVYPNLNIKDKKGSGFGRMSRLLDGLMDVQTMEDMMEQMKKAMWKDEILNMGSAIRDENGHIQFLTADGQPCIDWRTDLSSSIPLDENMNIDLVNGSTANCSNDFVLQDDKFEEIQQALVEGLAGWKDALIKYYEGDELPLRQNGEIYTTGISFSVNCTRKTMLLKFWEKEDLIYRIPADQ